MRVVFSVGSLSQADGGPSRSVSSLCRAVIGAGARAEIVTCRSDGPRIETPESVPVHEARYHSPMLRSIWGAPFRRALERRVREQATHIIHDNGLWLQTNHATARVARRMSVALVISPRGMLEPWSLAQGGVKKKAAWRLFQKSDLDGAAVLHATSAVEADNLRRLGLRQPIAIIPNGIESPGVAQAARRARGAADTRNALFLSRLHPGKGLLDLVAAWARIRPVGWRVIVAGPDHEGHKAVVLQAIERAGLSHAFDFVGPVDGASKRQVFERADLFVLPTASENFGLAIGEALAAGLPVITTWGAPWGGLEQRRCGWWIEHGVEPLVGALQQAMALTDDERAAMGVRGRGWIDEQFSWPRIGAEMVSVYDWILYGGSVPRAVHRP